MLQLPLIIGLTVSMFVGRVCPVLQKEGHNNSAVEVAANVKDATNGSSNNGTKTNVSLVKAVEDKTEKLNGTGSSKHICNSPKGEVEDMINCYATPHDSGEVMDSSSNTTESTTVIIASKKTGVNNTESPTPEVAPDKNKKIDEKKDETPKVAPNKDKKNDEKIDETPKVAPNTDKENDDKNDETPEVAPNKDKENDDKNDETHKVVPNKDNKGDEKKDEIPEDAPTKDEKSDKENDGNVTIVLKNSTDTWDQTIYDVASTETSPPINMGDAGTDSKLGSNGTEISISSVAPLLGDNASSTGSEDIVGEVKSANQDRSRSMPSGVIALVTAISFAIAIAIVYIGMIAWRRYIDYRYGHRELLVNELEFDTNDLRHFEL